MRATEHHGGAIGALSLGCLTVSIAAFDGIHTPIFGGLAYVLMFTASMVCVGLLLPALDLVARCVIAAVMVICLVIGVAETMLAFSRWSAADGLCVAAALWSIFPVLAYDWVQCRRRPSD